VLGRAIKHLIQGRARAPVHRVDSVSTKVPDYSPRGSRARANGVLAFGARAVGSSETSGASVRESPAAAREQERNSGERTARGHVCCVDRSEPGRGRGEGVRGVGKQTTNTPRREVAGRAPRSSGESRRSVEARVTPSASRRDDARVPTGKVRWDAVTSGESAPRSARCAVARGCACDAPRRGVSARRRFRGEAGPSIADRMRSAPRGRAPGRQAHRGQRAHAASPAESSAAARGGRCRARGRATSTSS